MIASIEAARASTSGSSEKGQTSDAARRARAAARAAPSIAGGEAAGDQRARPGLIALAGADRIADPHAGRRAEAHRQREGDIVDREHRLEGAGGGVAELGRKHHQPGEAGQLERRRRSPAPARTRRARGTPAQRAAQRRAPTSRARRRSAARGSSQIRASMPAAPSHRDGRGRIGRADRAQRRQAEMAADPGPGEQGVERQHGEIDRHHPPRPADPLEEIGGGGEQELGRERRAPSPRTTAAPGPLQRRLDADQASSGSAQQPSSERRRQRRCAGRARGPSGRCRRSRRAGRRRRRARRRPARRTAPAKPMTMAMKVRVRLAASAASSSVP